MRSTAFIFALASILVVGCGGSGGGPASSDNSGGGSTGGNEKPEGTALFTVNVETGDVNVTPLSPKSRAVFAGGAVTFDTTTFLAQGGDTGRRGMRVTLKNRTQESIGVDGPIRVIFSGFTPVTAITDLRTLTQVSTAAGSGVAGYLDDTYFGSKLKNPGGVAAAADGTIAIADTLNNRIRKLVPNQNVWTLAGSGVASSMDGSGTSATFNKPYGIAAAPMGGFYVCESGGNVIRYVSSDGVARTIAGTGAAGAANGAGNTATFSGPEGIAVGPDGVIYVADTLNNMIRMILPPPGSPLQGAAAYTVTTLAGSGVAGSVDGLGATASFKNPRGLGVAPDGNIYVADRTNHRVRRVGPAGDVVTIVGSGTATHVDGSGDIARMNQPSGLAVLSNTSFIVSEAGNHTLRQVNLRPGGAPGSANGWTVSTVAGTIGLAGFTNGAGNVAQFNTPGNLTFADGNLILADTLNHSVRSISAGVGFPLPIDGGTAALDPPILSNADGTIPDGKQYMEFDGPLSPGDTSTQELWTFDVPSGVKAFQFVVTVEGSTEVPTLLAGISNPGPSGVGAAQNVVRTWAGASAIGMPVDGPLSIARFAHNFLRLCVAADGTIFVGDGSTVRRIGTNGIVTTIAGLASQNGSTDGTGNVARFGGSVFGVACEPDGSTLYASDYFNHTVRLLRLTGPDPSKSVSWTVSTLAGLAAAPGDVNGSGDLARFKNPSGMTRVGPGALYLAEEVGHRIRKITFTGGDPAVATNWNVSILAGSTSAVAGDTDSTGTAARFRNPVDIVSDATGNLYVAEWNGHRIRRVTPEGLTTTFAGAAGTPAAGYADGNGTNARFNGPLSVGITPSGYLYVGDEGKRLRRISPSGVVTTSAGTGSLGDSDGSATIATFNTMNAVLPLPNGDVLVASGSRVRLVQRMVGP